MTPAELAASGPRAVAHAEAIREAVEPVDTSDTPASTSRRASSTLWPQRLRP